MARWIVALPLLLVGSLFFWSLALSLGGLSLMRAMSLASLDADVLQVAPSPDVSDGMSTSTSGPIMVHLQESAEPEDLTVPAGDNSGTGGYVGPDEQAAFVPGPGETSY
jgi:hypothetical protein